LQVKAVLISWHEDTGFSQHFSLFLIFMVKQRQQFYFKIIHKKKDRIRIMGISLNFHYREQNYSNQLKKYLKLILALKEQI